jgi:hypothetical protein
MKHSCVHYENPERRKARGRYRASYMRGAALFPWCGACRTDVSVPADLRGMA